MNYSDAMRKLEDGSTLEPNKLEQRKEAADKILNDFMVWWQNLVSPEMSYFSAFILSDMLFYDAVKCYEYGQFEAAMIMARDAIDSTLFFAVNYTPDLNESFYVGASPSGERYKNDMLKDDWRYLKTKAIEFKILTEDETTEIANLRDIGSFSAHLASRQDKQRIEYGKKLREGKSFEQINEEFGREPFMSAEESEKKLKKAAETLTLIRERYFRRYLNYKRESI
jgi:hypothetical protein